MRCRKCGREYGGKVGFGAVCEGCGAWLHCCLQCRLYNPAARRCRSSTTDTVRDRDLKNHCEEFQPAEAVMDDTGPDDAKDRFMGLFGTAGADSETVDD